MGSVQKKLPYVYDLNGDDAYIGAFEISEALTPKDCLLFCCNFGLC